LVWNGHIGMDLSLTRAVVNYMQRQADEYREY